ncbi:MAG: YdcF family protein [Oscillospiraceae bacterium]|nr:YdcF family protein [Oscillospiraceae bacterium]
MIKILKKRSVFTIIMIVIMTLISGAYILANCSSYSIYIPDDIIEYPCDFKIEYSEPGIVNHDEPVYEDGYIKITFNALKQGKTVAKITSYLDNSSVSYFSRSPELNVGICNIITETNNNLIPDIAGYPVFYISAAIFFSIMAVYMIILFRNNLKQNICSYSTVFNCSMMIFFVGFAILYTLLSFYLVIHYREYQMWTMHDQVSLIMFLIVLFSTPGVLIYSVSMTVSNISLIRHEGFRVVNALGIIISVIMTFGVVFCIIIPIKFYYVNHVAFSIAYSIVCSLYLFLELFLVGAKICGVIAAKHKPAFNKDYIIILGCGIRKDGTLLPLLKGRVDKAIEFYKNQLEQTGKKAVFIPSGGQGSDEIISEGEAMTRYLLEQGIPKEQIMPETKSANTYENMKFSKELIGDENAKVVFSTTNYHVFRSGIFADRACLKAEGMGSKTKWYFWPNAFIREFVGLLFSQKKKIIFLAFLTVIITAAVTYLTF